MSTDYVTASKPVGLQPGEIIKPCCHCAEPIGVNRWDSWNGFLVRCPHCHRLHGKRWGIKAVLFGGLIFNALSFFFTMRPRDAALALCGFALFAVGVMYTMEHARLSFAVEMVLGSIVGLGPVIINAVLLVRHEMALDRI